MQHEVTSRPSATSPAQPPAGLAAPDRPSGRSLLVEGLLVYVVLGLLTIPFLAAIRARGETFFDDVFGVLWAGEAWAGRVAARWVPADLAGQPVWRGAVPGQPAAWGAVRATCRSGCWGRPRWRWRWWWRPRPGRAGDVAVLPGRVGDRAVGAVLAGWPSGWVGELAAHHLVEPVAGDRLDAAGVGLGHLALESGRLRYVVLCGVAAGLQLLAGHPEEWVYTLFALATYGLAWSFGAGLRAWPRRAVTAALRLGGAMVCLWLFLAVAADLVAAAPGVADHPGFDEQYELPARWRSTPC